MSPRRARAVRTARGRFGALALTLITISAVVTTASGASAAPRAKARSAPDPSTVLKPKRPQHVRGRDNAIKIDTKHLFVKFRSRPRDLTTRLARAGSRINRELGKTGWTTLDVSDAYKAKARLVRDSAIAKVEYSSIGHALTVPNDPLYATTQKSYLAALRMDRAWDLSKGANVTVGILDTGVDFVHPDMAGRFASFGFNEMTGSGAASDDEGHGTMTSGLIAANINNAKGIAGIAPQSKILPVKVLDSVGSGTSVQLVNGLEHIATLPSGQLPKVVSMSIGGYGDHDAICAAVQDVIAKDIVVVIAAGNSFDQTLEFPSGCPGVVSVSATTHAGALASFSTFGTQIDIAAPGENITSTTLQPEFPSDYGANSGTSFSTPIVAGVAALIRSQHPDWDAQQTIDRLLRSARDVGEPGLDKAFGHGIVDPVAALGGPALAPHPTLVNDGDGANDTPATATPLAANAAHGAFIAPETDEDWYSLTLATGWYSVNIPTTFDSFGDPAMSPSVELYDTSNHLLAASTNLASLAFLLPSPDDAFDPLVFRASSPGTYRLRVRNVSGNTAPYTITVAGTAQPATLKSKPISFFFDTNSTAIGNLDDDNRPDVAFLMGDEAFLCDALVVMHQTPEHGLSFPEFYPVGPEFSETCPPATEATGGGGLVVADATGDGRDDAVFPVVGGVEIIPQVPGGVLDPGAAIVIPTTDTVSAIAIADLDADTQKDLVTGGPNGIKVYWSFSPNNPTTINNSPATTALAIGDVAGGPLPDIAANAAVGVAVNAGSRTFTDFQAIALSGGVRGLAVDSTTKRIVATQWTSPGALRAYNVVANAPTQASVSTVLNKPSALALGDLDGDNTADALFTYDNNATVGFVPSANGTESHVPMQGSLVPSQYDDRAIAIGDLLNDGTPEGVISTDDGFAIVRHRLDTLTANHGSHLLDNVVPAAMATGVSGSVQPKLTLAQPATNADQTTVRLLNRNGVAVDGPLEIVGNEITIKPDAPLSDGTYTIAVDGLHDAAGNTINGFRSGFVVGAAPDQVAPLATITGPSGFQAVNSAKMTFSSNDNTATLWCSRDNAVFAPCTSPVTMSNLSAAAHTFSVFARDPAGNESAVKTVTWTYRPPPHGYWMLGGKGAVYRFGTAPGFGSPAANPAVDIEVSPTGFGYWVVDNRGRVFALGDAGYYGSAPTLPAGETVTSISRTKTGKGYWLFTTKGRAIARGDATFYGDQHATRLNGPVLDSVATPSGKGYYMVASDGGVFSFGDARFRGSMGGKHVSAPVRTLTPDADGDGYWLIGRDGGVYSFNAAFRGSLAGKHLNKPIVGAVTFGNGYLMVASDGGVFNFSNRAFYGSLGSHPPSVPIVSIAAYG